MSAMPLSDTIVKSLYGAAGVLMIAGLGFAADQRIDTRVQQAIGQFQQQEIERQIQFYITKSQLAPDKVTPDDNVNRQVLERQLQQLRSK